MREGKIIQYLNYDKSNYFSFRFHVDLRPYPIILRIDRELEGHPAFRAAHPANQPDSPPEMTK